MVVLSRPYDHRRRRTPPAQLFQRRESLRVREVQVEQYEIDVRVRCGCAERARAVSRLQQLELCVELRENVAQRLAYERMVIDREHFHALRIASAWGACNAGLSSREFSRIYPSLVLYPYFEPDFHDGESVWRTSG